MRPSRTYKLFVSNKLWTAAHILCRRIGALVESHPFAPYINVTVLDTLGPTEWFIEGDKLQKWKVVGSLLWIHGKRTFVLRVWLR